MELSKPSVDNEKIINQDFKKDLNQYLAENSAPVKTLAELIAFNKEDENRRAEYGQDMIEGAEETKGEQGQAVKEIVEKAKAAIDRVLGENQLDAIVFWDGNSVLLPAAAGYPELAIPMGMNGNFPRGVTFIAKVEMDNQLLQIGYSFEEHTKV